MRLRHFVSASAIILCGWLAVTFVTEVPVKRYPKLQKHVFRDNPPAPDQESHLADASGRPAEIIHVSVSP